MYANSLIDIVWILNFSSKNILGNVRLKMNVNVYMLFINKR